MNGNYSGICERLRESERKREREREWVYVWMNESMRCVSERKVDAPGRGSRETAAAASPSVPRPRPRIPKLYYLPVLLIDSLLSAKKWYWSTMIIYVIIRPRCYRRTVFNKNFIWTKRERKDGTQSTKFARTSPGIEISGSNSNESPNSSKTRKCWEKQIEAKMKRNDRISRRLFSLVDSLKNFEIWLVGSNSRREIVN